MEGPIATNYKLTRRNKKYLNCINIFIFGFFSFKVIVSVFQFSASIGLKNLLISNMEQVTP
jgi:hypothetical protein